MTALRTSEVAILGTLVEAVPRPTTTWKRTELLPEHNCSQKNPFNRIYQGAERLKAELISRSRRNAKGA